MVKYQINALEYRILTKMLDARKRLSMTSLFNRLMGDREDEIQAAINRLLDHRLINMKQERHITYQPTRAGFMAWDAYTEPPARTVEDML